MLFRSDPLLAELVDGADTVFHLAAAVGVKTAKTGLDRYVDRIVDAFEVGYLKMRREYWPTCQKLVGFDPARALFVDDDEGCLHAAQQFGLAQIIHSAKSSSRLPAEASSRFTSIEHMTALFNGHPFPADR